MGANALTGTEPPSFSAGADPATAVSEAAGAGRRRALGAAALLGVATLAGLGVAVATPLAGNTGLALSAGVTLYVAAANLVPEVQGKPGWRLSGAFFFGSGLYFAGRMLLSGLHG